MLGYALRRLVSLVIVLFAVSVLVFVTLSLVPGSSALELLGPHATPERIAQLERELAIDRPAPVRYLRWLGGLSRGDLGHAFSIDRPVASVLCERLGPTLLLGVTSLLFGSVLGLLGGSVAARHHERATDRALRVLALAGISLPAFWLSMLAMLLLAVFAGWFPASGMSSPPDAPHAGGWLDRLHHLILPALALGLVCAGIVFRFTRAALLETLSEDFVRTARAKGLSESQAIYRHGFRAALGGVMPVIGLQAGFVIGGAVYVETIFQWPGLGKLLVDAILARDLILAQGAVLVLATCYVLATLLSDLAQRAIDPRVEA